jgi:hypothetical protein
MAQAEDAVIDHTTIESAAFADNRSANPGVVHLAGRQIARPGIDRGCLVVEAEGRLRIGQGQIGGKEGLDRADVLPVASKPMALP